MRSRDPAFLHGTGYSLAAPMRLLDHLHCAPNNPFGHGTGGPRSGKIADHIGGYRAFPDRALSPSVTNCQRAPCVCRPLAPAGTSRSCVGSIGGARRRARARTCSPVRRRWCARACASRRSPRWRRHGSREPHCTGRRRTGLGGCLSARSPRAGQPEGRFLTCPRHDVATTRRPIFDVGGHLALPAAGPDPASARSTDVDHARTQ